MKQKVFKCGHCGHEEPVDEKLKGLGFQWLGDRTSKTSCPGCKSYTLQKASPDFKSGEFLLVKTRNKIRKGKG